MFEIGLIWIVINEITVLSEDEKSEDIQISDDTKK